MYLGLGKSNSDPFTEFSANQGVTDTFTAWHGNSLSELILQNSLGQFPNGPQNSVATFDKTAFDGASQNNAQTRNTSQPGNSQNANASESNNQANAALNKAAQVKSQLQSASPPPSSGQTAKTSEKQAAAGGKQQAEQARKDVASAKEEVKESAGMEAGGAASASQIAMGSLIAHGGMFAGGAMMGVPGIASVASGIMTAYDTFRSMQGGAAPEPDKNDDDAGSSVEELEREEAALASIEDDYEATLADFEEREEQGIDVPGAEAGTPILYDDIALTSMTLNEGAGIVFTGNNIPVQATNDLHASVRDADGSGESGHGEATSDLEMSQKQIIQMGGPDAMALA